MTKEENNGNWGRRARKLGVPLLFIALLLAIVWGLGLQNLPQLIEYERSNGRAGKPSL